MKIKSKHFSLAAKIISIVYTIFLIMLSFDVPIFSWGFLIHLIPATIFLGCLIIAWFKPKIGGALFIIVGITTIIFFKTYSGILNFITISLIPIISGIFFWISKKH